MVFRCLLRWWLMTGPCWSNGRREVAGWASTSRKRQPSQVGTSSRWNRRDSPRLRAPWPISIFLPSCAGCSTDACRRGRAGVYLSTACGEFESGIGSISHPVAPAYIKKHSCRARDPRWKGIAPAGWRRRLIGRSIGRMTSTYSHSREPRKARRDRHSIRTVLYDFRSRPSRIAWPIRPSRKPSRTSVVHSWTTATTATCFSSLLCQSR